MTQLPIGGLLFIFIGDRVNMGESSDIMGNRNNGGESGGCNLREQLHY